MFPRRIVSLRGYTEETLPHGVLRRHTEKKLKNETIRSTSMSPIRKKYVLVAVFDGGVKDRRNEKKKRKLYVFKMYGRSTGYLPTYLRFCSLKYLSTD